MHKTMTLALGAGLFGIAALQFQDGALAAKKGSERGIEWTYKPGGKGLNPRMQNPPDPDKSRARKRLSPRMQNPPDGDKLK